MTKPLKVLQVFDSLEISGGVQGVVMNAYRKLDKSKVQFDFAVYDAPESNSYQPEIEKLGGRVIPIKNLSEAGPKEFYRQFVNIFGSQNYDAVHAHNIHHNGLILSAAKKCGVKIRISHSHQSYDERNNSFSRKMMANYFKHHINSAATRKIACSDLAGYFLYGKTAKFEILPNAVDISAYENLPTKSELRKQYGFSDEQKVLIHIGRFCVQKNQKFLIETIRKLRSDDFVLLIAGEGDLKDEILNLVKTYGLEKKVKYIGLRKDIPNLLKLSDIMLLPSIFEGLPMVAVEAQAAGCTSFLSDKITKQADLGVGLVRYLPIDNAELWADEIDNYKPAKSPHISEIHQKMQELKFDSVTNLKAWYELYGIQV